jgi:hypothetical protein
MALPPKTNQVITLADARKLKANYKEQAPPNAVIGGLFWKEYVEQVLNQADCVALRYYYGLKDDKTPVIILVGVNSEGNDLTNGVMIEYELPCPPYCPPPW